MRKNANAERRLDCVFEKRLQTAQEAAKCMRGDVDEGVTKSKKGIGTGKERQEKEEWIYRADNTQRRDRVEPGK